MFFFTNEFYLKFSGFAHLLMTSLIYLFPLQHFELLQKLRFELASSLMITNAVLDLQCINI